MFYLLEAKMNSSYIHGISLFGTQKIAVGFVDDTFIFAKAEEANIQNILTSLVPFSEASALRINMRKSTLINISACHFESLPWLGPKIDKGAVFRHLEYPMGVNISTKDKLDWVFCKIKGKLELWHSSHWPLHARVRIVQAFLQPYVMYYLLLLDWKKCHIRTFDGLIKSFLWKKKHTRALVTSAWDYVCQPKCKGGLGILHLHSHIMVRRAAFIMRITSSYKPLWMDIFWKFLENAVVYYKGKWKLDAWSKFFSHAPLHTSSRTLHFMLQSFKETAARLKWNGRQRYVGNSFASLSPYWSFLSNPPFAYCLGAAGRYIE
ncbi:hypothetical protein KP509_38G043400 [Ceratopteris richardii]|uniref:Reverse transcriptase domain-containing protein n=1 Tax=Ceratopteris richardii TaxID=49495 RepID=A0A8T2Q481_CERRI|nr:hypothetical protein KP509_38G043400 [Ceratopteris richardii]